MRTTIDIKDNVCTSKLNVEDGTYNITLSRKYDDKTVEQVRKLWATCTDISVELYGDKSKKDNIYLQVLKMAGQRTALIQLEEELVEKVRPSFKALDVISREVVNHKAWALCEVCVVGISQMDKREVSKVIESCQRYADEVGVPNQLEREIYD